MLAGGSADRTGREQPRPAGAPRGEAQDGRLPAATARAATDHPDRLRRRHPDRKMNGIGLNPFGWFAAGMAAPLFWPRSSLYSHDVRTVRRGGHLMWAVTNTTDFPAVGIWVQDKAANKIW